MTGTASQIEWAEQFKARANTEFDRVALALRAVSVHQQEHDRTHTQAILAILEKKRAEVMANDPAGYFIRDWQDLTDQVRKMIAADSDYQAIKTLRDTRMREKRGASDMQ